MFQFKGIKTKLILFNVFLIILAVVIFIGIIINLNRKNLSDVRKDSKTLMKSSLHAEWEAKLRAVTALLSNRLIQPMHNFDIFEMRYLIMTTLEREINYIYVHDKDGRVLAADIRKTETRGAELMGKALDDELTKKAVAASDMLVQENGRIIDIASPVMLGQKRLATLRIGFSTEGIQDTVEKIGKDIDSDLDRAVFTAISNTLLAGVIVGIPIIVVVLIFANRLLAPVYALIDGTKRVAAGDLSYRIKAGTKDEIGQLSESFNRMTEEIERYHTERDKVLKDLHDGIGGITTNIKLLSELAQNRSSLPEIKETLRTISELSNEGLSEIRHFIESLDSRERSWRTLIAELRSMGSSMIESHGLSFNMKASIEDINIEPTSLLYLNIFRTYKEALTNIIKHSKAKSVDVLFSISKERLLLTVKDDGVGLKERERVAGRGITNMIIRTRESGGKLTITSDEGAQIALEVPMQAKHFSP